MKKNLTELVFILDRSGSMGGLEPDTIGGFNAMLTRQKEQEGEANVTTILFDHEVQLLHDRFPLHAVAPLTEKDYYVRGCTALLDAIGYGVEKMVNIQRHLPEDERAEKVIFVITTDGLENASKRFSYEKIRRLIEREKERYGWEFLFLGANMDAVQEAAPLRHRGRPGGAVRERCAGRGGQLPCGQRNGLPDAGGTLLRVHRRRVERTNRS